MVNKGCLVLLVIVSMIKRVVSRCRSFPDTETSLQMGISFVNVNFLYKWGNLDFIFRQLRGG